MKQQTKKLSSIILGTKNPHKKEKLRWIVEGFFEPVIEMKGKVKIGESGRSFEENARIKAAAIAHHFNQCAIATDGGVLIPALGDNWNELLTKRFAGKKNVTDFDRINALLRIMEGKKRQERKIIWKEAVAIAVPEQVIFSAEVYGDTGILQESYNPKQYRKGIWLCTLWSYPQFEGRNFFELDEEETKVGEISWWKLRAKTKKFLRNYWKNKFRK